MNNGRKLLGVRIQNPVAFKSKWIVSAGITSRGNNGANKPWFGFCYGSFIPRFHWNGGRASRGEVVDFGWYWLCFHGSFTRWPQWERA